MSNPIYEIPVVGPDTAVEGWTPGRPSPVSGSTGGSHAAPAPTLAPGLGGPLAFDPPTGVPVAAAPPMGEPVAGTSPTAPAAPLLTAPTLAAAPSAPAPQAAPAPPAAPAAPTSPAAQAAPAPFTITTPIADPALGTRGPAAPPSARRAAAPAAESQTRQGAQADQAPARDEGTSSGRREARKVADPDLIAALQEVLFTGASDLHVTANASPTIRIDGGLRAIPGSGVWDRDRAARALDSLLTPQQKAMFERELELDFAYTVSANARFRVNYYQQRDSIGGAFRLIPTEIKQLKDLGVPDSVAHFSTLPRGLVLVTGPTGSGKSTTLAALIDLVNRTRADHIVTVEDPIEFLHTHQKSLINQREVGHDTHSFGAALKHVLRQDPDVILIGELRDLETISVALTAAETGHLVFATLHTQDAPQTIDRVIDVFPPHQQGQVRTQLAATLQGVVCQTLVKRASGTGRVVATEVLMTTPAISNLIREGKTYQVESMMQAGRELGMHTMDQHLADLVNTGIITHRAAMEKVHDPEGFGRLVSRVESPTEASSRALASGGIDFGDSYSQEAR